MNFGPKLNAICLPSNPSSLYEGETMIIAGWGGTEELTTSDKLLEASVEVIPNAECKEWNGYDFLKRYKSPYHKHKLCLYYFQFSPVHLY